ncbi:MAG TPA: universal stress protein [Bacteroidia bacterium]|nr:universal stress protein [Bacteroidia bacterium]HNT80572.1 universal stress protein [Bacteroidia bacterium]
MKILVATDYSTSSLNALEYAIALAHQIRANITLVHVFQVPPPISEVPLLVVSTDELLTEHKRKLTEILSERNIHSGIKVESEVLYGNTVQEISRYAHEKQFDLLVCGIESTGMLEEYFIGSTSMGFIRNSKVPVFIIPMEANYKQGPMVFAYDAQENQTDYPIEFILKLKDRLKSDLHVVTVLKEGTEFPDDEEQQIYSRLNSYFNNTSYQVHLSYDNDVDARIRKSTVELKACCLVMISHKHGLINRIFNETHTKRIAYRSQVPVLSIPEIEKNKLSVLLS